MINIAFLRIVGLTIRRPTISKTGFCWFFRLLTIVLILSSNGCERVILLSHRTEAFILLRVTPSAKRNSYRVANNSYACDRGMRTSTLYWGNTNLME